MAVLPCWADRCVQVALCSVPRDDPFCFCPVVVFVSMCRYVGIYYIYIYTVGGVLLYSHQHKASSSSVSSKSSCPAWRKFFTVNAHMGVVDAVAACCR